MSRTNAALPDRALRSVLQWSLVRLLPLFGGLLVYLPIPSLAADSVRFGQHHVQAGESTLQQVSFDLQLTLRMLQADQEVATADRGLQREIDREVVILELGEHGPTRGQVTYSKALQRIQDAESKKSTAQRQPIAGKRYFLHRQGQQLTVTDPQGLTPPADELSLVLENMQTFGQTNPISKVFAGRTLRVGEVVSLPKDMAHALLGIGAEVGEVSRFVMRLERTLEWEGVPCAEFSTYLEAISAEGTQLRMKMQGKTVMQVATCQAVSMELQGPVEVSESKGPADGQLRIVSQGSLNVKARSQHRFLAASGVVPAGFTK